MGLVPYTRQNFLLAFKPHLFFNELEKQSHYPVHTLRAAYDRARKQKLIGTIDNKTLLLSLEARQKIQPFVAEHLNGGGQLMVIFDIPETNSEQRRKFRLLLRRLDFIQTQQSVWTSPMDHRSIILESIKVNGLSNWAQLYEAARLA